MPRRARKRKQLAVVDTSVLVAGIAGFREPYVYGKNPNADLLYDWAEEDSFVWLYSEDILNEYKAVLRRLRVRPSVIGRVINLIQERDDQRDRMKDLLPGREGMVGQTTGCLWRPCCIAIVRGYRGVICRSGSAISA